MTVDVRARDVELLADHREASSGSREAIMNAGKHGGARNVLVSLQFEDGSLVLVGAGRRPVNRTRRSGRERASG